MSQLWINDIVKAFHPILQKSGIFEQIRRKLLISFLYCIQTLTNIPFYTYPGMVSSRIPQISLRDPYPFQLSSLLKSRQILSKQNRIHNLYGSTPILGA